MRRWVTLGLFVGLMHGIPLGLFGQAQPPQARAVRAYRCYIQGMVAFSELRYRDAVTRMEEATQLVPTNHVYATMLEMARQKARTATPADER